MHNEEVLALVMVVYFLVAGFLTGYLWARMYLPVAFSYADRRAAEIALREVRAEVASVKGQASVDAAALTLSNQQLDPKVELTYEQLKEMHEAVENASPPLKVAKLDR